MKRALTALTALTAFIAAAVFTISAFAAVPQKIKSMHPQFAGELYFAELDGVAVPMDGLTDLAVQAGSELRIYLLGQNDTYLFFDQLGEGIAPADISLSRLRAAQIAVRYAEDGAEGEAVRSVELGYSFKTANLPTAAPFISVKFAPGFSGIDDTAFSITVSLSIVEEPQPQTEIQISGAMRMVERFVSSADGEIDIGDGVVVVPTEPLRRARIALGGGVTITASLEEGERYYGVARMEEQDTGADPVETVKVCILDTIGLGDTAATVEIDSDVTLHVYGEDGAYLGTTRDPLPFSETYYLISRKMTHFLP